MDEQNKVVQQQSAAVPDYSNEINAMYDAQRASQQQQLEGAYNKNLSTLEQGKQDIAGVYNTQANDLATQYERTRRNNNIRADLNGLNTGTASQMDLAQQSNYMKGYGQVRASQAAAERQADRDIANLKIDYQNAIAQALAANDYQRATDLLKEHQRRDSAAQEEARYQREMQLAEKKYADQLAQQELENKRYETSYADKMAQLALENQRYATEYADKLAQQALQNQRYDTEWAAKQAQQALENQRYDTQWEQQLKQYADQMAQQQLQNERYDTQWATQQQQYGDEQALNNAKLRAAYGDFGGYEALYGKDTADAMKAFWTQANPDYAWANGLIDANTYYKLTGQYPAGYSTGSSSSSGGGHHPTTERDYSADYAKYQGSKVVTNINQVINDKFKSLFNKT